MASISIDYDEVDPETYSGVVVRWFAPVTDTFGRAIAEQHTHSFDSGNPTQDYRRAVTWAAKRGMSPLMCSSMVDHFISDGGEIGEIYLLVTDPLTRMQILDKSSYHLECPHCFQTHTWEEDEFGTVLIMTHQPDCHPPGYPAGHTNITTRWRVVQRYKDSNPWDYYLALIQEEAENG